MKERIVAIGGKVVARVITTQSGDVVMRKASKITDKQAMRLTGTPGWDAKSIDETFVPGVTGRLEWSDGAREYHIPIETFREHAFRRDFGFGDQYHCHLRHWEWSDKVVPLRPGATVQGPPKPPRKIEFGTWLMCHRCKGTGKRERASCEICQGMGIVAWNDG